MIRRLGIFGAVATLLVVMTAGAFAANPHVVGSLTTSAGPGSNQFTVSGKIAGLGGGYSGTNLSATATATFDVQCANPNGKLAPGQQGEIRSLPGTGAIDSVEKNGNYTFHVTFSINLTPAKTWGCPNNQWSASAINVRNVALTSLTLADGTQISL